MPHDNTSGSPLDSFPADVRADAEHRAALTMELLRNFDPYKVLAEMERRNQEALALLTARAEMKRRADVENRAGVGDAARLPRNAEQREHLNSEADALDREVLAQTGSTTPTALAQLEPVVVPPTAAVPAHFEPYVVNGRVSDPMPQTVSQLATNAFAAKERVKWPDALKWLAGALNMKKVSDTTARRWARKAGVTVCSGRRGVGATVTPAELDRIRAAA